MVRAFLKKNLHLFGRSKNKCYFCSRKLRNATTDIISSMKKSLFFFMLGLLLLAACGGGKRYHALMHEADSLLTAGDAVTAYRLLAEADSQKTAWSRREEMDYELLKAQAQNRAYVDFQTDSVLRVVARYYDRHGTPNQRLRAHYLLGCAYRDLHEAPLALLSWEDAVACADTLSPDCDFATLFRVYGQMADVYFRQFMPEKELVVRENFCHYALLAGDTLNYIRGLLLRNSAYLALGDTNAVFRNINHVRDLYLESGRKQEAAQVYPTAISIALDNKQYDRAHSMMIILENESGLFDERGNIKRTYEKYYYQKGRYYLGVHQNDSAEQQFRKLLSFDIMKVDGYQGLIATFRQKQDADSIYKYSELYSKALVQYLNYTQTEAIAQAEGMYDYHRLERIAASQAKKAHRRKVLLTMIASVCVITLALIVIYFRRKKELQEKAFQKATTIYLQAKTELDKLHLEV